MEDAVLKSGFSVFFNITRIDILFSKTLIIIFRVIEAKLKYESRSIAC